MPTANEELLDRSIRHSIGLNRYSSGVVKQIIQLLNQVDDDLVAQILKFDPTAVSGSYSRARLEKLLEAIRAVNKEAYAAVKKELTGELRGLAAHEADFQSRMITASVPIQLDIVKPSASQLYAAVEARPFQGRFLKDWFAGLEQGAQQRIESAIQIGFVEGESIDKIVRRVRGTRANQFRDGALEINRRSAQGVVRTAISHTANVARQETYKANEDVIKGERYTATLDSRTSLQCSSLDGQVFPVGVGPRPPQHPGGCRSTTVPILKSWKEMGFNFKELPESTRSSMNGQVPESTTYNEWLRKQPKDVQEEALGKTKAKLYRDGGLSVDRFVDRTGAELTLDELRKGEADAFKKAGID